tara:strand:+ start:18878 stop:21253 length:2376 start_codon:yes stop_codon:yes gene_type:complete
LSNIKKIIFVILSFVILIFSIFNFQNFRIDASSDTLVAQSDTDFEYFNKYTKLFKSQKFLIIAVEIQKEIDEKLIKEFELLSSKLLKLDSVNQVFSFIDAPILFLNNLNLSNLNSNKIETISNTNFEIKDVLKELSNNPIYLDQIINKEENVFSLIIYLKENEELNRAINDFNDSKISKLEYQKIKTKNDLKRRNLISNIREIIKNTNEENTYYLGGIDMIANDVINFVKNDIIKFSISVIIIIIIVLFTIFRNFIWVTLTLASSTYALIVIFGMLGFAQIEVTAISSNFAALIFILSISMNIHIINYYRLIKINEKKLLNTIKNMIKPCLYTTLTTMVAFGSLIITDIKPIVDFGYIMILALIISLICSFSILPLLIILFINNKKIHKNNITLNFNFIYFVLENSKKIIFLSFFLFFLSIIGITNLKVENSFVNYFKKNTEIFKGMNLIDKELGGTTPIDIILNFNEEDFLLDDNENNDDTDIESDFEDNFFEDDLFANESNKNWFTDEKLKMISTVHNFLENRDETGKVQSISSLIELSNSINKKPLSLFELSVLYEEIPEIYKEDLIYPYLLIDKNMAKITARVRDSQNIERKKFINDIKQFINENKNASLNSYQVNGLLVLYNNMLDTLFESQIKSLGFIIIIIFLMFFILFKSIKLSIVAIIPNIFASSFILGIMGYLSIPLDIMTITIAAISIGIAVDNTIHYLYRFREFNKIYDIMDSIHSTNLSAGLAVIITSITIASGFSILILSNFVPTVIFGIFTSMAMIFAMIGVIFLLPSLLVIQNKW